MIDFSAKPPTEHLKAHLSDVTTDTPFRSWCRLKQSLYRQEHGWDPGMGGRKPRLLGNYLVDADAKAGRNFLSPEIFVAAKHRTACREKDDKIEEGRLLGNLLTSQTMCFNLFLPQAAALETATLIWQAVLPKTVTQVNRVLLEHSPGRGDEKDGTGDHSAFDAAVFYRHVDGSDGLIAIETKYSEPFSPPGRGPTPFLQSFGPKCGLFSQEGWQAVLSMKTQQLWRTHLLAQRMKSDLLRHVTYLVLHPSGDVECSSVLPEYRNCLEPQVQQSGGFRQMTLEKWVAKAMDTVGDQGAVWLHQFYDRYLDWSAVELALASA